MSNRRLPSVNADSWSKDILNPRILILEVYKENILQDSHPTFTLIMEKKEEKSPGDNSGLDTLTISYRVLNINKWGSYGWFGANYNKYCNEFSIISDSYGSGALFLDPSQLRGYKIGTYIMNQIIIWAKHNYPEAKLQTFSLFNGQAQSENKDRRNRFYEQFGIEFHYEDDKKESGTSKEGILIKQLNTVESWKKNIKEVAIPDYFISSLKVIDNQKQKILNLTRVNESFRKENEYYWNENVFQFIWRKLKSSIWLYILIILTVGSLYIKYIF